jgi:hypothetical protein
MHFLDYQHLFLFLILINNLRPQPEPEQPTLRKGKQLYWEPSYLQKTNKSWYGGFGMFWILFKIRTGTTIF